MLKKKSLNSEEDIKLLLTRFHNSKKKSILKKMHLPKNILNIKKKKKLLKSNLKLCNKKFKKRREKRK
jgi:hypothetical protein